MLMNFWSFDAIIIILIKQSKMTLFWPFMKKKKKRTFD